MWSVFLMIVCGLMLLLSSAIGMLAVYLFIRFNMEDAAREGDILPLSMKILFRFTAVMFFGAVFIFGFMGGLDWIDQGVQKWDSFEEVKK